MKTLKLSVTLAAVACLGVTVAGPTAPAQAATAPAPRIVNAAAHPVTAARVVVSVATAGVANGATVTVYADGRVLGRTKVISGRAILPIATRANGSRITVNVAGKNWVITMRTDRAALQASPWLVINKRESAGSMVPPLQYVGWARLQPSAAGGYLAMSKAAAARGTSLKINSAYRSAAYQSQLYWSYVARDGRAVADTYSARPGHSEHQTGLAVDVAGLTCTLSNCFGDTPAGRFVKAHGSDYGFIVRYPAGAGAITGYRYEPWHLRYVGPWLAGYLKSVGSPTLEQAFWLPPAPDYLR